jgi:hypothetical protein
MNRLSSIAETGLQHVACLIVVSQKFAFAECHVKLPIAYMRSADPPVCIGLRLSDNRRKGTRGC